MPIVTTNFVRGRMNKSVDERLLPPGEYINAINVRLGSTETTEIGAVENSKGNTRLTTLQYNGATLTGATCIGAYEDGANETMYWFITSATVDMVVSFNTNSLLLTYHVVSTSILNFNIKYLINGINKIGDLLFWTDDINPPRKINVTSSYPGPDGGGVDQITAEDINVIVKPPINAPTINLLTQATEANYMETRLISFSYRYKYKDDEYSALSQFTDIAFVPGVFALDVATNLNSGMKNIYNAVQISFNTGGANVVAVDLIYKFGDSNVLNVIEKFDKEDYGWPDNSTQTQTFSNSKIYTILPESELLRLYDNVPRTAKAQTIMGNRLVYGNNVDGYNLIDSDGNNCHMTFNTLLISSPIDLVDIETTLTQGDDYTLDGTVSYDKNTVSFDLEDVDLIAGAILNFDITFLHEQWTGNDGTVSGSQPSTTITTIFTLPQDYGTVYEMVTSTAFKTRIGSEIAYFVSPLSDACSLGTSLTDAFNCAVINPSDSDPAIIWTKLSSGITGLEQGIKIGTTTTSTTVTFQLPAMKFTDTSGAAAAPLYEYYKISNAEVTYVSDGNTKSLHSNRNYEVGIVYMDEYLRSSTALVSPDNTIFTPASFSNKKSQIKVTIPITQKPPYWATSYKYVIKRAEGPYETIYSNFYYQDTSTNTVYFKLEGQNTAKVKTGDILRVKTDNYGALTSYQTQEALQVEAKEQNFLTPAANVESGGNEPYISELAGVYMELKPTNFNIDISDETTAWSSPTENDASNRNFPSVQIACFRANTSDDVNLAVPEGSLVTFDFDFERPEKKLPSKGSRIYKYHKTFAASNDYENLYDFVIGENIDFNGGIDTSTDDGGANENEFINTTPLPTKSIPGAIQGTNRYRFSTTTGGPPSTGASQNNFLYLGIKSGTKGLGRKFKSSIRARISVQIANSIVTFETIPIDVDTDIYYEEDQSYNITGGYHMGGTQNQTSSVPAITTLGAFDCFAFGNGVESFKIEDSLVGQSFTLGQRVTSVSDQDYKEADRYAGMTYSGLYSEETNVNRLNEFNLGLANFKDCEVAYGPIEILHARQTDILCLQEDKISYVQAGKDLLTTAAGEGAITSSPLILGHQIARIEEYGISNNPESFDSYGDSMYFTDAKRNVVIQLKGAGSQVALNIISEYGMRSYFRDLFTGNFGKQKLGGFDPYMNEYVLSSTTTATPSAVVPIACGTLISRQTVTDVSTYTLTVGAAQGTVSFPYTVTGTVTLLVVWDSVNVINQSISGSGTLTFVKTAPTPTTATVTVTPSSTASFEITPSCPVSDEIIVVQMTLGSPADSGKYIHNQYYWTQGSFTSPVSSELIVFEGATAGPTPVESWIYTTGQSSIGVMPAVGSTITMQSNKIDFDDFVFKSSVHKFKYLVSATQYDSGSWATIDAGATTATPIANPSTGLYEADFTYTNPIPATDKYLYLVWDYREPTGEAFRYGATQVIACCSGATATFYMDTDSFETATALWTDATLHTKAADQFYQLGNLVRQQDGGLLSASTTCEACGTAIPLCSSTTSVVDLCCTGCTYSSYSSSLMKSTRGEACALSQTETYYHNGAGATPVVNDFVFANSTGTALLSAGYYSLDATSVIYVNSSAMVENLLTC